MGLMMLPQSSMETKYLEVAFEGPASLMRGFSRVLVTDSGGERLRGALVDPGSDHAGNGSDG